MTDKKEVFEKEDGKEENGTITIIEKAPATPASDAPADKAIIK